MEIHVFFFFWMKEYDYTRKVNEKIDDYNLEVAFLELGTKREPSRGSGSIWTLLNGQDSTLEKESRLWKALDEEIMALCYLKEMSSVFKLILFVLCLPPHKLIFFVYFLSLSNTIMPLIPSLNSLAMHEPKSLLVGKESCSFLETKIGSLMKTHSYKGIWYRKIIPIIKLNHESIDDIENSLLYKRRDK